MKSKEEDGTGLANCSEGKGTMTAWWRWNDNLKGREDWDDLTDGGKRIQLGRGLGRSARQDWMARES